jgi:hypothetical protein
MDLGQDPITKVTRVKRAGGVAQAVEHFPSKHKALSTNPSNTKTNKQTKNQKIKNATIKSLYVN